MISRLFVVVYAAVVIALVAVIVVVALAIQNRQWRQRDKAGDIRACEARNELRADIGAVAEAVKGTDDALGEVLELSRPKGPLDPATQARVDAFFRDAEPLVIAARKKAEGALPMLEQCQ